MERGQKKPRVIRHLENMNQQEKKIIKKTTPPTRKTPQLFKITTMGRCHNKSSNIPQATAIGTMKGNNGVNLQEERLIKEREAEC